MESHMLKAFASCLLVGLVSCAAHAETASTDAAIPPALRDWRPWVTKDLDYRACPFLANSVPGAPGDFICAWPGRLTLSSNADGATFAIHWRVEAPSWVPLPGDEEHWPQQVSINGQRQPVLLQGGLPRLWLAAGSYEVSGRIPWREQPQTLALPQSIGLVTLNVDGKTVSPVRRDGNSITLGRVAAAAPEADSLDLRVYRKLADGVPAFLSTRVVISVSGQAREEVVGPMLPEGFTPVALSSAWPARLDNEGRLHVQVQPGRDTLMLEARATAPLAAATAHFPAAPWPKQEIWSYEAAPRLRVTAASGAVQVDPRQAEVPTDWQMLPAFALGDGATLTIEERSRGLAPDEASRLSLQREAWFDFDGGGWFARDRLTGRIAQGWRFDTAAPFALEQATAQNSRRGGGQGEPLLITRGAKPDSTGVEWRTPNVDLAAGVRILAAATMPVSGWEQTFDNVQATLHFPFGYKLLAAPGADSAAGSWASGWDLLDAFVCAIATLLAWRLLGIVGAGVTVAYLLLGYQESGSPMWSLLATLALALIARALPAGKLVRVADLSRRAALVVLVLVALPFVAGQVRYALYPQLEQGGYNVAVQVVPVPRAVPGPHLNADGLGAMQDQRMDSPAAKDTLEEKEAPVAAESPPPMPASAPAEMAASRVAGGSVAGSLDKSATLKMRQRSASNSQRADQIDHYSETTVVQTGGGAPNWNLGSTAWLSWNGPVLATQDMHLLIAPPWLVRLLRIVLVTLLAWLLWRLIGGAVRSGPMRAAPAVAAALILGLAAQSSNVQAQAYPTEQLLQQLRTRLSEAPKCAPACASIAEAQVTASGETLAVALEVHAGERVALPLPGDATGATVLRIQVDGAADDALMRDANGGVWLAIGRGVHRVQVDFAAHGDKVALAFPLKPARVLFQGRGWDAAGLVDDRLQTETLTLARARENASTTPDGGVQQFPPYVRVVRSLNLGLEWSASTTVERLSPAQGGFAVDVPALAGEHVSSAGIKVQNGKVPVAIADGQPGMSWQSTLDKADALTLTAPALGDRAEVWRVLVSPTWHVDFSGTPGVGLDAGEDPNDFRNFEFHPLPGETLTLRVTRPAPVQSGLRAIDAATLHSDVGQRASTHVLGLMLRASQGGDQVVTLPKDVELLGVSRDGQPLNLRLLDGRLSLPVVPGSQRFEVRFRDAMTAGFSAHTPAVALGLPAANVALTMQLPADRWLLATFGPPVGPAVLYWGELIVMIALAYGLTRTRRTRLNLRDWLLLGLGFSTFSWIALLVVVAWLFAFDWRARGSLPPVRWQFNLLQVVLALLTLVALICLVSAIPQGLLGQPDMHVTGNGSYTQSLHWFTDRTADTLPQASAISLPLWVYKVLMLAWALWLANALIGWLRDAFSAWLRDGYWRARVKPVIAPAAAQAGDESPVAPTT
jgi:hypothetical protein